MIWGKSWEVIAEYFTFTICQQSWWLDEELLYTKVYCTFSPEDAHIQIMVLSHIIVSNNSTPKGKETFWSFIYQK